MANFELMTRLAIITPFNDIESFKGGSRASIKKTISYFDQFLMLYYSICKNWKSDKFTFQFYVIHSLPFNSKRISVLKKLKDVKVIYMQYAQHETKIRPLAYTTEIDCDFRLVLDVDMIALRPPVFDFSVDVQAMYGGTRYNEPQWRKLCSYLGAEYPDFHLLQTEEGNFKNWGMLPHVEYHLNPRWANDKLFPYFNNGAVLVRNTLSFKLGKLWEEYREKYAVYLSGTESPEEGIQGQNVIGIAIHNITKNWKPLPRGCNFILQNNQVIGKELIGRFPIDQVSLFHYIHVPENTEYWNIIHKEYRMVIRKHYHWFFRRLYAIFG